MFKFKKVLCFFTLFLILFFQGAISTRASQLLNDNNNYDYGLGCLLDHPGASNTTNNLLNREVFPSKVDMSGYFPAPGDQGNQNSCVGWALGYALKSYVEGIEHSWNINENIFSPSYIYNQLNEGQNKPISLFSAADLIVEQGVCTLNKMPYNASNYTAIPSASALAEASKYKSLDYHLIGNDVSSIKQHLANRIPVVVSFPVDESFYHLTGKQIYNGPSSFNDDGHAVCIIGYDDSINAYKFINSWGTGWGDSGYGYFSYDYLTNNFLVNCLAFCDDVKFTLKPNENELGILEGNSVLLETTFNSSNDQIINYSAHPLQWKSSNQVIATINEQGLITAKKKGDTTISCSIMAKSIDGYKSVKNLQVPLKVKSDVNKLVSSFYINCLGRQGDRDGIDNWSKSLVQGKTTGAGLVEAFFLGNEYINKNTSNSKFLEDAYNTILGRNPDTNGKQYYMNQLDNGVTRRYVLSCLVQSSEFTNTCNYYNITRSSIALNDPIDKNINYTMFTNHFYKTALGRNGSKNELNYYVDQLLKKQITGSLMAKNFVESGEFVNKHLSNELYIKTLYLMLFNRSADTDGIQYWNNLLNSGTISRYDMLKSFTENIEFKNLCNKYGVPQGLL